VDFKAGTPALRKSSDCPAGQMKNSRKIKPEFESEVCFKWRESNKSEMCFFKFLALVHSDFRKDEPPIFVAPDKLRIITVIKF
jgi:hypothetical protein